MFGEPFTGDVIFQCVINVGLQAFFVWICHICIVKVGMIFVEAEILRTGNEQLLDDLEEGVIIQKDETNEILFMNKAIQKLSSLYTDGDSFIHSALHPKNSTMVQIDLDLQLFARIDYDLLNKQETIDAEKIIE